MLFRSSLIHLAIALIVLFMMFIHQDVEESDQSQFQIMAHRPTAVAMEVIAEEAIESAETEEGGSV